MRGEATAYVRAGNSIYGNTAPSIAGPIWFAFALVLLTVAVVGTVSYWSTEQLAASNQWMSHTNAMILGLQALRDSVDAAESAQRGYILMGDTTLLEPVATARASEAGVVGSLDALTAANPRQRARLLELEPEIEKRISLIEQATAIRTQSGRDAATDFIEKHNGPALTAAIHAQVHAMIEAEDKLTERRGKYEKQSALFTLRVLGIGALAALCFVTLAAVYIQRAIARLRQATELARQRTDELARSESALRTQSALQQSVFEAMGEGVIVVHRSISEPTLNAAARRILAIDDATVWSDWLKSTSIWREAGTLPLAHDETPFARIANDPESGEIEMLLRQPGSGALVVIGATSTRLVDEDGKPSGGVMVLRDITDRKREERRRALLAALIEGTQYAIMTMRGDRIVLTWNPGAETLYGYSADEMIGRSVSILTPPERDPEIGNLLMSRLVGGGSTEQFEATLRRKDGTLVEVTAAMSTMRDARGKIIAISSISYDITDRKRAERELQARTEELSRSNAELEQFAYVASHDLQEPLRMVASYVQLIQQRYQGRLDPDADEFINFAVDGASRMKQLINDLLMYSRAGRAMKSVPVAMDAVVDRALDVLQLAVADAHAKVTRDPLPKVMGDEGRLYEVMQNLISNALKFRGERLPEIHVGIERRGADWLFSVRDNGIGIAAEYKEKIFAMFQRLHGREAYEGTGIGLAVCKRIVELLGGNIWMDSIPGRGSTVFFTLPATPGGDTK